MDNNVCIEPNMDNMNNILLYLYNLGNTQTLAKNKREKAGKQIALLYDLCTHDPHSKGIFMHMWNKMTKKIKFPPPAQNIKPEGFDDIIRIAEAQLRALEKAERDAYEHNSMMKKMAGLNVKGGTKKRKTMKHNSMMKKMTGLNVKGNSKGGKNRKTMKHKRKYIYKKN